MSKHSIAKKSLAHRVLEKIQLYSWLLVALGCIFVALVFWAMNDSDELQDIEKEDLSDIPMQIQPQKVAATTDLGMLNNNVKPLDLTVRTVTVTHHDAEFKGTKFIQSHKRDWTIEVFRASDENSIRNYLRTRKDRKDFMYFRLSGQNVAEQYVLAYGTFSRESEARAQLLQLNFDLPASVKPNLVPLSSYANYVNDLGSDEAKSDNNQLYQVVLNRTAVVAPAPVSAPPAPVVHQAVEQIPATEIKISRRDGQNSASDH